MKKHKTLDREKNDDVLPFSTNRPVAIT